MYLMDASTKELRRLAGFIDTNLHVITNALGNHAERMDAAAAEARSFFRAGQADPAVEAAQDASLLTNKGLLRSAEMFEQEAAKAREVSEQLSRLVEGDEDEEG
jgi:hypothetical protein